MFNVDDDAVRINDQGYITSHCFSPTLGHTIALGFVKNGRARMGEVIKMVDLLRNVETKCEICNPVFWDEKGGALRG